MALKQMQLAVGFAWGVAAVLLVLGMADDSRPLLAAGLFAGLVALWLQLRVDSTRLHARIDRGSDHDYLMRETGDEGVVTRLRWRDHG